MRIARIVSTTVQFIIVGAAAGVVVAFASLTPLWLGMTPLDGRLDSWMAQIISMMGAICGAVVTPVFGWLIIGRVGFWRAVLEPMAGAIICTIAASFVFRSLQTDVLIYGAFVGALLATARVLVFSNRKSASGEIQHASE